MEQIDEELIEQTVKIGINTLNDLENQSELLLEDAAKITKQSLRKIRGRGSFLNMFYYDLFDKQNDKQIKNLEYGLYR